MEKGFFRELYKKIEPSLLRGEGRERVVDE
jgi:hypothetical protein